MGFEDLLRKKLGPMADLVPRRTRIEPDAPDPTGLWYRRAVPLEVDVRPEASWNELSIGRADRETRHRLDMAAAGAVLGMSDWVHARDLASHGLDPTRAWQEVTRDLLFYAEAAPTVALSGKVGALAAAGSTGKIARRASAWPTLAVETMTEIAPMPFMPRRNDLNNALLSGARFSSIERGHEVLGVTIAGGEKTGRVLRALLPRLDGRSTRSQILEATDKADRAHTDNMLGLLDRATLLEAREGPPAPGPELDQVTSPQVMWIGHGAVLLQTGTTNILVDPIYSATSEPAKPYLSHPKLDPRALPKIDAVLITHGDNDHLNPHALAFVPSHVPIVVPKLHTPPAAYEVDIAGILRVLGFSNVCELELGQPLRVGDARITPFPFWGEDWDLDLPKATYLVEHEAFSVFFSADAAAMDDCYRALGAREKKIDLAFMGVSGNAEAYDMAPSLGYGNFYSDWVPRVRANAWVEHCAGPAQAAASLALFQPRFAFGYAAGGASYIRTSYSDRGDHDQLADLLLEQNAATHPVALPIARPVRLAELDQLPPRSKSA